MSISPNNNGKTPTPPDKSTVILLLSTIGDTTWRMFIPTIGFTILGVMADRQFESKPWFTFIGIAIGVVIAAQLIRRQIQRVSRTK